MHVWPPLNNDSGNTSISQLPPGAAGVCEQTLGVKYSRPHLKIAGRITRHLQLIPVAGVWSGICNSRVVWRGGETMIEQAIPVVEMNRLEGRVFFKCPLGGYASLSPGRCPKCHEPLVLISVKDSSAAERGGLQPDVGDARYPSN